MNSPTKRSLAFAGQSTTSQGNAASTSDWLLGLVDAGLVGVIAVAPYFFGGRHDLGRFVFVALVSLTSIAWCARQALRPTARWKDTAALALFLLAVGLLVMQIAPLPAAWIDWLAPRTAELLPLWQSNDGVGALGTWNTLSFVPHETTKALAMLLAYGLLFVVTVQRIETIADMRRLLRCVALSALAMASFGLIQYLASNGKFFWFYDYPFRSTDSYVCGSFINRNHFANFLVLGVGPLVAWLLESLRQIPRDVRNKRSSWADVTRTIPPLLGLALAVVSFAIVLTTSRGGTLALLIATIVIGGVYAHCRCVESKHLWLFAGTAVVVVGLLSIYGFDTVTRRLSTVTEGSMDALDRDAGRRKIWSANIAAFRDGGLAGAGAGSHALIYPVYLPESVSAEYTHAESSYLQLASETGFIGVTLLATGLGLCGVWCFTCVRQRRSDIEGLYFGATCGGLAASVVHSIVDFVWYIPACMSVTLVLAACVLRLAQMAGEQPNAKKVALPAGSWLGPAYRIALPLAAVVGCWMAWTFVGPAGASIHWDSFQRVSIANRALLRDSLTNLVASRQDAATIEQNRRAMLEAMVWHLERAVGWDPDFARARFKLATRQVEEFDRRQRAAANAMDATQVRDAALASTFASPAELRSWLNRAFGKDCELLDRALQNARAGLTQSPLDGDGYLALASVSFLERADQAAVKACIEQGLRVRPHDGDLLFEVGRQAFIEGDSETALRYWQDCFRDTGRHQLKIVYLLAGKIPATLFIESFQPDWRTLSSIWLRYRAHGQPQDLAALLPYAAKVAERDAEQTRGVPPDSVWLWLASMYTDTNRPDEALNCLRRAYACNPRTFEVRFALGKALLDAKQYAEAEPHFRWCMARRPENKDIGAALGTISRQRRTDRHPVSTADHGIARAWEQ